VNVALLLLLLLLLHRRSAVNKRNVCLQSKRTILLSSCVLYSRKCRKPKAPSAHSPLLGRQSSAALIQHHLSACCVQQAMQQYCKSF
jgi:hypothetical protein